MRQVTDLLGMPVIPARGGVVFGTVTSVELDIVRGRICFLHVSPGIPDAELIIPWSSVCTVDARAITVFTLPCARTGQPQPPVKTTRKPASIVRGDTGYTHPLAGYQVDEHTGRVQTPSRQPIQRWDPSDPDESDVCLPLPSRAA